MIYFGYIIAAALVVVLSVRASHYVDLLEKNTTLSGAFLGGIMLSAVTSLPELFTSVSATVLLNRPGLCMGNILGSDLFNLAVLALMILLFFRGFSKGRISKSYRNVAVLVFCIYIFITLNFIGILDGRIFTLSVTSILIALVYGLGAKYLSITDDLAADEDALGYQASISTNLSVQQIAFRFFVASVGIITFSIILTCLTEAIAVKHSIGQGLAGALFLGIATSLPEVSATIALFKMKNYNIAVGNIIGSNLFNFIILCIADLFSLEGSVYIVTDPQIRNLLICGAIATPLFWIMLRFRNKTTQAVCALGMLGCYGAFLLL
ncbi:MAG: cation transporter [Emergencia sp.]|nr:cation transporter [Emergencia sp.]